MPRFLKVIFVTLCGFMAALLLVLALIWLNLPSFAENRLRRMVGDLAPEQPFVCTVRRIGLHGADLEGIVLGAAENPALVIASLRLDYSFPRLLARQVDRLAVNGLRVRGRLLEGQFVLEGFPLPEEKEPPESLTLPLALGLLTIEDGLLACRVGGEWHQLPFAGRVVQENPKGVGDVAAPLAADFILLPAGQEVRVRAMAALADRHLRLSLFAAQYDLQGLAAFVHGVSPAGRLRLEATAAMALAPLVVEEAALTVTGHDLAVAGADRAWLASAGEALLSLEMAGEEGQWRLKARDLLLAGPGPARIPDFEGSGSFSREEFHGAGKLRFLAEAAGLDPLAARAEFDGGGRQGDWRFVLRAAPESRPSPEATMLYDSLTLQVEQVNNAPWHLSADLAGLRVRPGQGRELFLPAISLRAREVRGQNGLGLRAELTSPQGSFHDQDSGLRLEGISARLPFVWPVVEQGKAGTLAVRDMTLTDQMLGGLSFQVRQQGLGLALEGEHRSLPATGFVVAIRAEAGLDADGQVRARGEASALPQNIVSLPLGRLANLGQELSLDGRLELQGNYRLAGAASGGEVGLVLGNGRLSLPDQDIVLEGVDLSLALTELPRLRSLPAQPFSFATARVGGLAFSKGSFRFQLEPSSSLFIEGGETVWAGGRLHAQSLRLSPESEEYAMTLFADRLNLAQVLAQFGVQEAEGGGTLSGRIPFVVSKGRLSFEDAFLYSAPGEGGRIRIAGLGLLAAGVPKGTPQHAQLDFADEALRDFQYNWARLRLITEKDELLLQMQLDGQPAQPIPFRYDGRLGSFSRLLPGESGGIVHPIRLDMNLRLPLEKIMEYGGGIQKLLKP